MSERDPFTALVHSYARIPDGGDIDGVVALFEHSTRRSLPSGSVLGGAEGLRPDLTELTETVAPSATASSPCYRTGSEGSPTGRSAPTALGRRGTR